MKSNARTRNILAVTPNIIIFVAAFKISIFVINIVYLYFELPRRSMILLLQLLKIT